MVSISNGFDDDLCRKRFKLYLEFWDIKRYVPCADFLTVATFNGSGTGGLFAGFKDDELPAVVGVASEKDSALMRGLLLPVGTAVVDVASEADFSVMRGLLVPVGIGGSVVDVELWMGASYILD